MRKVILVLILTTAAVVAIAPGAGAHGREGIGGETANGTNKLVVAYGRFLTKKVHRIHVVRVCLQRRTARGRWKTLDCAKEKHFKRRDDTVVVSAGCRRTRVYRAKVFGHIINDKDQIRHRERLTTRPEAVACDK